MIVPGKYLPPHKKVIDYNAEAAAFLTGKWRLADGYVMPSPPAGWYTMLELITSNFFLDPYNCDAENTFMALALLDAGKAGVFAADEYRKGNEAELRQMGEEFAEAHGKAVIAGLDAVIHETLILPFQGLDMLPKNGPSESKEFLFDAEFLATLCGVVSMTTGETLEYVVWKMPLLRAGYIRMFRSRYEGEKHIERPDDQGIVRAFLKEAEEKEKRGELLPWQIAEPLEPMYQPTEVQIKARAEIVDEFFELMKKAREKIGETEPEPVPEEQAGEAEE